MEEITEENINVGAETKNYIDDIVERISGDFNIYVKDLRKNKVFYEYKADEKVDCRNLAGLPVLFGTMNGILDKKIKLKDKVNFIKKSDDFLTYIVERGNGTYTVEELLEALCITNDRNALKAIYDHVTEEQINKFLDSYGLAKRIGNSYNETMQNLGKILELAYKKRFLTPRLCNYGIQLMERNRDGNSVTRQILDRIVVAQISGESECGMASASVLTLEHTEFLIVINVRNAKNTLVARRVIGLIARALYDEFKYEETLDN